MGSLSYLYVVQITFWRQVLEVPGDDLSWRGVRLASETAAALFLRLTEAAATTCSRRSEEWGLPRTTLAGVGEGVHSRSKELLTSKEVRGAVGDCIVSAKGESSHRPKERYQEEGALGVAMNRAPRGAWGEPISQIG